MCRGVEEGLCRGTEKYVAYKRGHVTMNLESLQLERLEHTKPQEAGIGFPPKPQRAHVTVYIFVVFKQGLTM